MAEPFVGRGAELAVLDRQLERVANGHGGFVLLAGPAGSGKSALARHFAATRQARSIFVSGDADETALSGGLCEQIARRLAGPQALTLRDLLKSQPADALYLGSALLDALRAQLGEYPLAVVVDDAQWGDELSLKSISFAARRLASDPVLCIAITSSADVGALPPGLVRLAVDRGSRLDLSGLTRDDVMALARQSGAGRLPSRAAQRLRDHTDGLPVYVCELLHDLPASVLRAPGTILPAPRSLTDLIAARLAACREDTERLVVAAAVLGSGCTLADAAALARLTDPLAALAEATSRHLLAERENLDGQLCEFPHEIVRAAVYRGVAVDRRASLHQDAVALRPGSAGLTHRVAGRRGTDESLARDLVAQARADLAAGLAREAAGHLLASIQVTGPGPARDARLVSAVQILADLGDAAAASSYAGQIIHMPESVDRTAVLARLAVLAGDSGRGAELLAAAWQVAGPEDGRSGHALAATACELALLLLRQRRGTDALCWAERAAAAAPSGLIRACSKVVAATCLAMGGRLDLGRALLEAELAGGLQGPGAALTRAGLATLLVWDDELDAACSSVSAALEQAAVTRLPLAHVLEARLLEVTLRVRRGSFDEAISAAEQLVSLAEDLDQGWILSRAYAAAVVPYAVRGQWQRAARHIEAAVDAARGTNSAALDLVSARVSLAFARDDLDGIIAAAEPLTADLALIGELEPALLGFWPLFVQALVRAGRTDEAEQALLPFERLATTRSRRSAVGIAARARAVIEAARQHHDLARDWFLASIESLSEVGMPFEEALTRLEYGRFLRRQSQPRAAQREIGQARQAFALLSARPFLTWCDQEAGGQAGPAGQGELPLTPRQLAVAQAVAVGKSNRQVATDLYVTVKTVEFHVTQILSRLGIDSRGEIARALARGDGRAQGDPGDSLLLLAAGPGRPGADLLCEAKNQG